MNRKLLSGAVVLNAIALLALLAYSLERTSWLFARFELDATLPLVAAVVVEIAAIALLVGAGAIAQLDRKAQAWANRALGAVLSVQALANLSAGYLRGGHATLALFAGDTWGASYAVAAALWLSVNLAVPALIFFLSKLLERLIAAWQHVSDLPLREEVARLRETIANADQLLASATTDLAMARESETGLRERLATAEELAANEARQAAHLRDAAATMHARLANQDAEIHGLREQWTEAREQLDIKTTIAAREHDEAANLRRSLASGERTAANKDAEIGTLRESLRLAREEIEGLRELAPTRDRILFYVRAQLAHDRSLSDIAREVGFNESTLRGMLKSAMNGHLVEEGN